MRIRTIKPSFYKNEKLAELPVEARMLFVGLWGLADRDGRLEYRPKYIKAEIFPYDSFDVAPILQALDEAGFIEVYMVGTETFIQVINFSKHQRISGKEADSTSEFPASPLKKGSGKKGKQRGSNGEAPETTGREGKGKEGKGTDTASALAVAPRAPSSAPNAIFVEAFGAAYKAKTGHPYEAKRSDYITAAALIKAHGLETCIQKVGVLGVLCERKSAWFTKDGFASFTIGKLSNQWNSIIPEASQPTKEDEEQAARRKVEEQRERTNAIMARG